MNARAIRLVSLVGIAVAGLLLVPPVPSQSLNVGDEVVYSGGPTQPPQSKKTGSSLNVKVRTLEIEYVGGKKGAKSGAGAAPKAGPLVLKPLPGRSFDELVALLGDTDPNTRGSAVVALAAMKASSRTQVAASLIPTLWDGDNRVVAAVATSLGKLESKKAVEELLKLLNQDEPEVLKATMVALGAIGDPRAVSELEALADADDPAVSPHAAKALEAIRRRQEALSPPDPPDEY